MVGKSEKIIKKRNQKWVGKATKSCSGWGTDKTIENAARNSAAYKYFGVGPTPSTSKLTIVPTRTVPAKRVRKFIRRYIFKQYIIHSNYRNDFLNILKGYSAKLNSKERRK